MPDFSFDRLSLINFGTLDPDLNLREGEFVIQLRDADDRAVQIRVPVLLDPARELSFAELEEQARDAALDRMKAAVRLLESHRLEDLHALTVTQDTARDAAAAADLKAQLARIGS